MQAQVSMLIKHHQLMVKYDTSINGSMCHPELMVVYERR